MCLPKMYIPNKVYPSNMKIVLKNWPHDSCHAQPLLLRVTLRGAGVATDSHSLLRLLCTWPLPSH